MDFLFEDSPAHPALCCLLSEYYMLDVGVYDEMDSRDSNKLPSGCLYLEESGKVDPAINM